MATNDLVRTLPQSLDDVIDPVYTYLGDLLPIGGPLCVQRHCSTELTACLADDMCRKHFSCAAACGQSDSSCTFMCSVSYQSKNSDNLMHCIFEEYNCAEFPDPDPNNDIECREPLAEVVNGVDHHQAQGNWYIKYGYNKDYDCFDCQISTFTFPRG